jgi:hypothetical protein
LKSQNLVIEFPHFKRWEQGEGEEHYTKEAQKLAKGLTTKFSLV